MLGWSATAAMDGLPLLRPGLDRGLNCLEDLDVARAATQIPFQGIRDFRPGRMRVLIQECPRRHDEAGRAIAALNRAVLDKRPLHGVEPLVRGQPLDRRY